MMISQENRIRLHLDTDDGVFVVVVYRVAEKSVHVLYWARTLRCRDGGPQFVAIFTEPYD